MTLVVLPEGEQRSGSGSGIVWSHNRYGAYTRNRSVPVNPNTARQVLIRTAVAALTIAWQNTLTQLQRDAWEVYASNIPWKNALGQTVYLTGFNHFIRSNVVRKQVVGDCAAAVQVDDGPVIFNLAAPEQELLTGASEATQTFSIFFDDTHAWCAEAGAFEAFYMGLPQNAGINFFNGPWRYMEVGCGAVPPVSPIMAAAPYPFAEGQRVWVQSRISRADGRLSDVTSYNSLMLA